MSERATRTSSLFVSELGAKVLWPHPWESNAMSTSVALALPLQRCTNLMLRTALGISNGSVSNGSIAGTAAISATSTTLLPLSRTTTAAFAHHRHRLGPPTLSPPAPIPTYPLQTRRTSSTPTQPRVPIQLLQTPISPSKLRRRIREHRMRVRNPGPVGRAPCFEQADGRAEEERWLRAVVCRYGVGVVEFRGGLQRELPSPRSIRCSASP